MTIGCIACTCQMEGCAICPTLQNLHYFQLCNVKDHKQKMWSLF